MTGEVGTLHVAQAGSTVARAGAADRDEAELLDGAGDEFAVEAAADEDSKTILPEAPRAGQQAAVPEGVDTRGWYVVAGSRAGFADVAIAQCDAQTADHQAHQTRDEGEDDALLQGIGGGHPSSLPSQ